jgi:hypothetical protein
VAVRLKSDIAVVVVVLWCVGHGLFSDEAWLKVMAFILVALLGVSFVNYGLWVGVLEGWVRHLGGNPDGKDGTP